MKKKTYKTIKQSFGSGGWIEGYEKISVPITKLIGKNTNIQLTVKGHEITVKTIREAARYYPIDIRTIVCKMSNQQITEEFL